MTAAPHTLPRPHRPLRLLAAPCPGSGAIPQSGNPIASPRTITSAGRRHASRANTKRISRGPRAAVTRGLVQTGVGLSAARQLNSPGWASGHDVLENEIRPCAMPITRHTYDPRILIDAVNNPVRFQDYLANQRIIKLRNNSARKRKPAQPFRLLDQSQPKSPCRLGTIRRYVEDYVSEVFDRTRSKDYFVIHDSIISSTLSIATPSPRSS